MTDNVKVAISSDFLTAFARLPRQVQGKVTEFVNKFRNNPMAPGINYEKLNSGIDKKIFLYVLMILIEVSLFVSKKLVYTCFYG